MGVTGATCVQSYLLSESWPSSVPHCGLWISKGSAICKSVLRKWENRKTEKQGVGVAPGHLLLGVHHRVTANAVVSMCTHHHEPRHMTPPQPGRPEAIQKQECPLHVILHKPSKITCNNLIRKKKSVLLQGFQSQERGLLDSASSGLGLCQLSLLYNLI